MKQRQVIYTSEARADLVWIYHTIADASHPVTASRYEQRIRAFCEAMDIASQRGTSRGDVRPGLRVIGFERRVTITFTVEDEQVIILRIYYGGRDWEEDFR